MSTVLGDLVQGLGTWAQSLGSIGDMAMGTLVWLGRSWVVQGWGEGVSQVNEGSLQVTWRCHDVVLSLVLR